MNKSFALFVLALGLILGSSNGENMENQEKVESNPSMSCLLYGNKGCNIGCVITGQLFHYQSRGICDSNQLCTCLTQGKTEFRDLWKDRFNSEYVFDNISRNKLVYNNVFGIFRNNMFKTNEELKQSLEYAISPYQFSILETNSQNPAARYTKDGKFDKEALQKYISEKLDEELKSECGNALLDVKYREIFKKTLETYKQCKGSMFNYTFKVEQLKNTYLENILEKFFEENNMEKPKVEIPTDHEPINRIVGNIVVNELINQTEENFFKDEKPSLSCLLFGKEACHIGCTLTGQLFNFKSEGVCDQNNICTCHNHRNSKLSDTVPNVQRTKDGRFDESFLEEYVTESLDDELESESAKSLLDVKYKEKFRNALENSKNEKGFAFDYTFKVTKLKNENLQNIFNEFFNENKMEKPDFGTAVGSENEDPIVRVNDFIVNELIKRIEENSKEEIDKDVNPSLSCILFGNEVCDDVCVLYARLMKFQSKGVCDSNDICNCHNFKGRKISDSQRPAVRRVKDGKFNEKALVKFVTENVDKKLNSESGKSLLDVEYVQKFRKALEKSKNEKDFVSEYNFKITQLKNKTLGNIFNKFLKDNKMKTPNSGIVEVPDDIYTILLVDNTIINTIIDRIENKSKPSQKSSTVARKKTRVADTTSAGVRKTLVKRS